MLSTMISEMVDATAADQIAAIGVRVLAGQPITLEEALYLFSLEESSSVYFLLSWANRVREQFMGNRVHLCSIVNVKSGGCAEDCKFCAQSGHYETAAPRYGLVDPNSISKAAEEAERNGVGALGLVAAWKGLDEGPILDEICARFRELRDSGRTRPDASLGIIRNQRVAERLKEAGVECYNHNLETSCRFFPEICTTHTFDDRVRTIRHLKNVGIKICSGGIIGMGETRRDRCDLAFALRDLDVDVVPVNFLNPIPGTPFGHREKVTPLEALKTVACFRMILPRTRILMAGGREVTLRGLQSLVFMAGASGMMVGNYLTTLNRPVEQDLEMIRDLGLEIE
jgi:biotin synthase